MLNHEDPHRSGPRDPGGSAPRLRRCAPPIEKQTVINGPHGGTTLQLPEKKGFVELVNEPEPNDRRKNEPTALVAYFLKIDGKTPLEPAPTDVSFEIAAGASGGRGGRVQQTPAKAVPLAAEPKTDDPSGACRFASQPGAYLLDSIRGTLNAKVDGQAASLNFAVPAERLSRRTRSSRTRPNAGTGQSGRKHSTGDRDGGLMPGAG